MRGPDGELVLDTILQERYKITDIANKSPGSRTYKCIDLKRNRSIFLKEMIATFTDPSLRQQAIEQFKCEAKILFKLRHENLPRFEDYFDYEGNRYLTFEYIEGKRLHEIIESMPGFLPESQVVEWGIELCEVLYYLHNTKPNPVIFRDLSPQSTLLSEDEKLKLIDFGIAKIYDADAKTMGIAKTMTPHYSPIEQHAGTTDERSDIYSLGATLYYLICKTPPMDCVERIIDDEPMDPPSKYNPHMSKGLENVILKAMEVDKKDRYQKIEDMQAELKKIEASETKRLGPGSYAGDDPDEMPPPEADADEGDYKGISFEMPAEDRAHYGSAQNRSRPSPLSPRPPAPGNSLQRSGSPLSSRNHEGHSPPRQQSYRPGGLRRSEPSGQQFQTNRLPGGSLRRPQQADQGGESKRRFLEHKSPSSDRAPYGIKQQRRPSPAAGPSYPTQRPEQTYSADRQAYGIKQQRRPSPAGPSYPTQRPEPAYSADRQAYSDTRRPEPAYSADKPSYSPRRQEGHQQEKPLPGPQGRQQTPYSADKPSYSPRNQEDHQQEKPLPGPQGRQQTPYSADKPSYLPKDSLNSHPHMQKDDEKIDGDRELLRGIQKNIDPLKGDFETKEVKERIGFIERLLRFFRLKK